MQTQHRSGATYTDLTWQHVSQPREQNTHNYITVQTHK